MRAVIQYLIPLLLPAAVFIAWTVWRAKTGGKEMALEKGPWFWLAIAGFALATASLVAFGLVGGHGADSDYQPPRFEDGKIVPGTARPRG